MLVISRQIDRDTIITVPPSDKPTRIVHRIVEVRGHHNDGYKVRSGWIASPEVIVNRLEVEHAIAREKEIEPQRASKT